MIWREPPVAAKLAVLVLASVCEVWWAVGLAYRSRDPGAVPADVYAAMVMSIVLLRAGMSGLPIGTAYAVWTGLGAIGTATVGILRFNESANPIRLACIGLICLGIVGLAGYADEP